MEAGGRAAPRFAPFLFGEGVVRVPSRCCSAMAMRAGKACRAAVMAALHAFVIISPG